ncbi:MAG: ABC transporter permease, partial [Planctomycetota bacterium]
MIGVLFLALRHTAHAWGRSTVLAACVLVVVALPLGTRVVLQAFEASLRERAATVPVVVGAKGSRYDLVFNGLYFRASDLDTTPWSVYGALLDEPGVGAVPVNARFSARGIPIVAVTFEYFELRSLRPAAGRLPAVIGECVLGSNAARRLGLGPGDTLTSDQLRSYDITAPPSLRMSVAGVLAPARTPDDDAVFVDIESAWVLEGIA